VKKAVYTILIILIAFSLVSGLIWNFISYKTTNKPNNTQYPNTSSSDDQNENLYALEYLVKTVEITASIYKDNKELIENIKTSGPLYIWAKQYIEETANILKNTSQWNVFGNIDYETAEQLMNRADLTTEDRLYITSMEYLDIARKIVMSNKGITNTINTNKGWLSGIESLVRSRAAAYTLNDWKIVKSKTSTAAKLSFIKDKSKDWETAYSELKGILHIQNSTPDSIILDIGSNFIAVDGLANISITTYKNVTEILENRAQDININNLDNNTLLFMLYTAEYSRVGIEILSALKHMEHALKYTTTLSADDVEELCHEEWGNISNILAINIPMDNVTATEINKLLNDMSTQLKTNLKIRSNTIGSVLISNLVNNYDIYMKIRKEENPDTYFMFYLTAQSKGIAQFLVNNNKFANIVLVNVPDNTDNLKNFIDPNLVLFQEIYNWEIQFIEKTYKQLLNDGKYPLIMDTFLTISSAGYTAKTLLPKMQEVLNNTKNTEIEKAKEIVKLYKTYMIDILNSLIDTLTIQGAISMIKE